MWQLQLVPANLRLRFMRWRLVGLGVSVFVLLASLVSLGVRGLNFGIDFKGGILLELGFEETADLPALRTQFAALELGDVTLQNFGSERDVLVRIAQPTDMDAESSADNVKNHETIERIRALFNVVESEDEEAAAGEGDKEGAPDEADAAAETSKAGSDLPSVAFRRVEVVGPQVSAELVEAGTLAVTLAVLLMLVYIWFRFEWQFSIGALLALIHDVVITLGVFSLLQINFDLSILAALLTIVGYSMNDTVVIYDRVREFLRKYKSKPLDDLLDLALNSTMARTVMTSVTTLLALFSLYGLGGEVIRGFTFAMIFGVLIGTYSSVFIACPLLHYTRVRRDWSQAQAPAPAAAMR